MTIVIPDWFLIAALALGGVSTILSIVRFYYERKLAKMQHRYTRGEE